MGRALSGKDGRSNGLENGTQRLAIVMDDRRCEACEAVRAAV